MPLAPLTTLLADARAHGYALGYFEAWDGYSLEAVVEAAEAERAPVIIGTGCLLGHQPWFDGGGIELLGALGGEVARRARVPVALLLNETHTLEQSLRGLDAGFNAVMMHTGDLAYEEAVAAVAELVAAAHARGAAVEAELGNLPDAVHGTASSLTDPGAGGRPSSRPRASTVSPSRSGTSTCSHTGAPRSTSTGCGPCTSGSPSRS